MTQKYNEMTQISHYSHQYCRVHYFWTMMKIQNLNLIFLYRYHQPFVLYYENGCLMIQWKIGHHIYSFDRIDLASVEKKVSQCLFTAWIKEFRLSPLSLLLRVCSFTSRSYSNRLSKSLVDLISYLFVNFGLINCI